ncbi:MAG: periplasmic binding protein-like I [Benjaminiella poitrasii]|nr:MAG: periplasmic binding protein-like I [Benjaminiella poitrasii]
MENETISQQLQHLSYTKSNNATLLNNIGTQDFGSFPIYDNFNNYTFSVARRKGTTFISPVLNNDTLVELKVGVLLPFHQSNNGWTRIMTISGISAIRFAVAEINAQKLIPGAYITLIEKDSYPKAVEGQAAITQAVFSAISLIQEGVIGVIGDISSSWTTLSALMTSTLQIPQCSFSAIATSLSDKSQFGYFFRTAPTNLLYSDAAITFITSQGWPQLGVLYSDDDFGQQLSENVVMKARLNGIHIKSYQSFYENGPKSDIKKSLDTFMASGVRVIFIAAESAAQLAVLTVAGHSGYVNDNTVWITIDADTNTLFAAVNDYNSILARRANNTDVIPALYNATYIDELASKSSKISRAIKKQSLIDLIDPVEYAARSTTDLRPMNFNATFSGGVFMFDTLKELPGYSPFDDFLDRWSHLDPTIYPYGGQRNISGNEALAYSCMMVMANGFKNAIYNSSAETANTIDMLKKLASGQYGQYLTPSAFNDSFIGPEGPVVFDQNGDIASGNFRLYNIQNGSQIEIGRIIAGHMNLTSMPLYHDGTTKIPPGVPDRQLLNPGYNSPVTISILAISSLGSLVALFSMALVLIYRKREVFKASSPLFCVLELVGFLLAYVSLFFFVGYRTKLTCTIIPITFHLGYALVLGNLIAKNYRIYRIFNNIFITKTAVTDIQLLKVSGSIFAITGSILIIWFSSNKVSTVNVPVSRSAYYVDCAFEGANHTVFVSLLAFFGALQLLFATFLAFKTKAVGRNYSKYSEYKQIGLSVYNIFFSVLIGFIIFFIPTTDYYTRHYLTATMIVWATTFSLLTLFIPKLHAFFSPEKDSGSYSGKASDISGRQRAKRNNAIGIVDNNGSDETACGDTRNYLAHSNFDFNNLNYDTDLMSLNNMVHNSKYVVNDSKVRLNKIGQKGRMHGMLVEVHEAEVPVQHIFKYFPFLTAWEMVSVVLMPNISYFSFYSEKLKKGEVFPYSGSSVLVSRPNEYVLKVHGIGLFNVIMQVGTEKELMNWNDWFNTKKQISATNSLSSLFNHKNNTELADQHDYSLKKHNETDEMNKPVYNTKTKDIGRYENFETVGSNNNRKSKFLSKRMTMQEKLDSGITERQLLRDDDDDRESDGTEEDEEYRRGSTTTVSTLVNCYYNNPISTASEYGMNEIINAREAQQQRLRQQQVEEPEPYQQELPTITTRTRSIVLSSMPDMEHPLTDINNDHQDNVTAISSSFQPRRTSFFSPFGEQVSEDIAMTRSEREKDSKSENY